MSTQTVTVTKTTTTTKRTTMTRVDSSTLRAQARMRRARVLGHNSSNARIDTAKLFKTRSAQARARFLAREVAGVPISLPQPTLYEVDPMALAFAGLEPEMANIGGAQMRRLLQPLAEELYSVNARTRISTLPLDHEDISNFVRLSVPYVDSSLLPSHCLGVFDQAVPAPGTKRKVTMFPIHAMVLAANCCQAPPLRLPLNLPQASKQDEVMVPLIPFGVPSAETFLLTLRVLYKKEYHDAFFPSLCKGFVPASPDENASVYLIQRLQDLNVPESVLLLCLKRVHGLWSNATALGIVDNLFWRWLHLAWGVYRDALDLKRRSNNN